MARRFRCSSERPPRDNRRHNKAARGSEPPDLTDSNTMAKPRNDFIDRLQYIGLRLVTMSLHCWPVELNLEVAKLLGNIMYTVDRKHRDRALGNLRRSFPEMPERQRHE